MRVKDFPHWIDKTLNKLLFDFTPEGIQNFKNDADTYYKTSRILKNH